VPFIPFILSAKGKKESDSNFYPQNINNKISIVISLLINEEIILLISFGYPMMTIEEINSMI